MPRLLLGILSSAAMLSVLLPTLALAHVTSTGVAVIDVVGERLRYRITIDATEVEPQYMPVLEAAVRGDKSAVEQVTRALRDYVRFSIGGDACQPGPATLKGAAKVELELTLTCAKFVGTLWMRDDWPEVLGAHFQTVMTVNVRGRIAGQFVFLDDRREATLELHAPPVMSWSSFVLMGAEHILGGLDHLLFLVALLALSRSLWTTITIVTGFTVAHSITLSLAVLGVVDVPSRVVEPLIAASIVWVAMENVLAPAGIGRRWLVATLFGLVHGLGFAGSLLELGMLREALVRALVGFNVGVELGQILFVAIFLPATVWLSRPGRLTRLPRMLSVAVAAIGTMWFLERVFLSP